MIDRSVRSMGDLEKVWRMVWMHSGLSSSPPKDVSTETRVNESRGNESAVADVRMNSSICVT